MLIDLVCDNESVVFLGKPSDQIQLFQREYFSCRIGGITQNQRFCILAKSLFQRLRFKMKIRRYQRQIGSAPERMASAP